MHKRYSTIIQPESMEIDQCNWALDLVTGTGDSAVANNDDANIIVHNYYKVCLLVEELM